MNENRLLRRFFCALYSYGMWLLSYFKAMPYVEWLSLVHGNDKKLLSNFAIFSYIKYQEKTELAVTGPGISFQLVSHQRYSLMLSRAITDTAGPY